jgi:hypothetical protein
VKENPSEIQLLALFAGAVSEYQFLFFLFFTVATDCCFITASWWFANRFEERHGRGSSKGMLCSKKKSILLSNRRILTSPSFSPPFPFLFHLFFFELVYSTRSATSISDAY